MPPFIPRKRLASSPPEPPPAGLSAKRIRLADALDAEPRSASSFQGIKEFTLGGDDSESSLSDIESHEFEDIAEKVDVQKTSHHDDEDESIDWEDAVTEDAPGSHHTPIPSANLQLTFSKDDDKQDLGLAAAAAGAKKGPSRRERAIRIQTHCLHVQFLVFHNAIRNRWICDKKVQETLVQQLPAGIVKEVEKWRVASGLVVDPKPMLKTLPSKGKIRSKSTADDGRNQRDWGQPSQRLEEGKPDLSHGDPLIQLMKVLSAYWKKRFAIRAPGLRKRGYYAKTILQRDIASFRNDKHDVEKYGERIRNLDEFRQLAQKCEGSRDVGAQLFTALLRGLGIESRLVASLQPTGYGWTKAEQAEPRRLAKSTENMSSEEDLDEEELGKASTSAAAALTRRGKNVSGRRESQLSRGRGRKGRQINPDSDDDEGNGAEDDDSVIDVTPSIPTRKPTKTDRDLPYPIYWTEVVSPIFHTILPVSPLVLKTAVATTPEILLTFEPRGAKAERVKQVIAYVIAYSSDGTAKDVTTRYLKRQIWPGKTKGFRIPVDQVPIYNNRGKIKHYEEYDWFKTVMSGYVRTENMRTAVDDVEESSDLVPQQPDRKEARDEGDTLQSLKSSADFVLERFLRREEALRLGAKPDRIFVSGKGDKRKEELVYRRADVERCLTTESWHKEGRRPKEGAMPMKHVAVRAVTLTRKREVEEVQRQTGEKPTQGLYSWDQTEYIIPPPIENGIIPKNAYGNMDCFVETMVPKGAVHIPLRGTVRICKKLEINYAEAVTGFEFGNKRAVPVITGVVVAKENETKVRDTWKAWNEEQKKREEGKLEQAILALWKKFTIGLRIHEKVQDAYGEDIDMAPDDGSIDTAIPSYDRGDGQSAHDAISIPDEDDSDHEIGGGFLLPHEDDMASSELVVEHDRAEPTIKAKAQVQYLTPISMASAEVTGRRKRRVLPKYGSPEPEDVTSSSGESSEVIEVVVSPKKRSRRSRPLAKQVTSRSRKQPKGKAKIISPYFDEDD